MVPVVIPDCVSSLIRFIDEVGDPISKWTFSGGEFPFKGLELASKLLFAKSQMVSLWIGCNTTDSIRKDFDDLISQANKSFLRLEVLSRRLSRINERLRNSDRAKQLIELCGGDIELTIAGLSNFINDLLESIGHEQPVAPVYVPVDPMTEDGLCSSSRVLTWGGVRYSLTRNQLAVVKVLHDAFSKGKPDVGLAELKNKCDSAALDESFSKVFQLKRNGKKSYNPVLDVIESLSQGTYRLNDKKKF